MQIQLVLALLNSFIVCAAFVYPPKLLLPSCLPRPWNKTIFAVIILSACDPCLLSNLSVRLVLDLGFYYQDLIELDFVNN